jgi:hypothetical protein
MKRVRRRWAEALVLTVVATIAVAVAKDASATTILAGNLRITINGAASPKALPKSKMAPIGFHGSASIATDDGTHLPPVTSSHLEVDKHIGIDTTGLPSCTVGKLTNTVPSQAKKACAPALIGTGSATAEVEFPDSAAFLAKGPLLIFNGSGGGYSGYGRYGGQGYPEQIYYVFAHVPAPTTFVVVGKLSKGSGKYGYNVSIAIPPIAGGSGSLKSVDFTVNRKWSYKGQQHSYLNAECANGHFFANLDLAFGDGTNLNGTVADGCQSTG